MRRSVRMTTLALLVSSSTIGFAQAGNKLIVYGDMALFYPPGHPDNCVLRNRFKRGEPVGWRMFVADPQTGNREESAQLVVHVNFAGKTQDIPMRWRATAQQPERQFWVAKWIVPNDAPTGIVKWCVVCMIALASTNSLKVPMKESSVITASTGNASGSTTPQKICVAVAPSTRADSSSSFGIVSKKPFISHVCTPSAPPR